MDLTKLNDEQRLAVTHEPGHPAVVCASAGAGKTTCLTARVKYLIDQGASPRRICCLTFTNRAAREILERVGMATETDRPRIGTIHSLALSCIRKAPKGFGLSDTITPLDEWDQKEMLKKLVEDRGLEEIVNPYLLQEKIGFHRARCLGFSVEYTPEVHERALIAHGGYHALSDQELEIWAAYEKMKILQSVVDFDDMLHLVVKRGHTDEKWLAGLQRQFEYVLQDETQDSSPLHWSFINMLLPKSNLNMFCVGDCSQSIYGFNGAEPQILLNFTKEWRGVQPTLYKLERNHRSVPEIVALANKIQSCMTDTIPLKMESYRGKQGETGDVILLRSQTPRFLAMGISDEIARRRQFGDTAILIRAKSQVRDIEVELIKNRIPYVIRGAMGLLQTEEVKDILSYLKIASNPHDFSALRRSIGVPKRGIGDATLERIQEMANKDYNGNLIHTIRGMPKFSSYVDIIDELVKRFNSPDEAIDYLIHIIRYEEFLKKKYAKHPDKLEIKISNLGKLKELIVSLMTEQELTIHDVVFQLTMSDQQDIKGEGKVVVSTIHTCKGLEYKTVYVVGLYEGSVPHKWCTSDSEISEERRIFYVACTRAKDTLVLGVPAMVEYYNRDPQFVAPSRFLTEIGICK